LHNPVPIPPPTTITAGGQLSFDSPLMGTYGWLSFEVIEIAELPGITEDGDILMSYNPITGTDIFVDQTDLTRDAGLRTAMLISLLTDRVADSTDVLPDNTGERRGWWADPTLGSKLWLLFRSSLTPDMPSRIESATKEALQWMLDEGVASEVIVNATIVDRNTITWEVSVIKPGNKDNENFKFFFNWENEIFGEVTNGV